MSFACQGVIFRKIRNRLAPYCKRGQCAWTLSKATHCYDFCVPTNGMCLSNTSLMKGLQTHTENMGITCPETTDS